MTEKTIPTYQERLESVSNYNSRLLSGRRSRIPFYDPSTGVAYSDGRRSYLAKERGPGAEFGQIYTYPSCRWKARPRPPPPIADPQLPPQASFYSTDPNLGNNPVQGFNSVPSSQPGLSGGGSFLDPNCGTSSADAFDDASNSNTGTRDSWANSYVEKPAMDAPLHMHDSSLTDFASEEDDFEEEMYTPRPSRGRPPASKSGDKNHLSKAGRARKNVDYTVIAGVEKKFSCNYCEMCYKTRPGLTYHVTKEHPGSQTTASSPASAAITSDPSLQGLPLKTAILLNPNADRTIQRDRDGKSLLCDICEIENPTVKPAPKGERLLSCSSCGHSAHPTCLNFSKNQRESTRHYPWKCIECKSCSICNSNTDDEKLLFCDDCDRGYHMYCVKPPLDTTPEGLWSCVSCLAQYGEEAANRVWKRQAQQEAVARYQRDMEEEEARRNHVNPHGRSSPRFSASMERH